MIGVAQFGVPRWWQREGIGRGRTRLCRGHDRDRAVRHHRGGEPSLLVADVIVKVLGLSAINESMPREAKWDRSIVRSTENYVWLLAGIKRCIVVSDKEISS